MDLLRKSSSTDSQKMKKSISTLLLSVSVIFFSCKKDVVNPNTTKTPTVTTSTTATTTLSQNSTSDNTAPVTVNGYLRLKLLKDTLVADGILINFVPTASSAYVPGEDAPALQGFGTASLQSLSSNNIPLSINALPLTEKGQTIGLKVWAKKDGIYSLSLTDVYSVPDSFEIWLKDSYKKDSLDMRQNHNYAFNIYKADTTSFGAHRFKLVIREK
jgi:hypothetical protein